VHERAVRVGCVLLLAALTGVASAAERFPARLVRIVAPFSAGGSTDLIARTVAQRLQEAWGQPVVVENRPGASGAIAGEIVARAPADGHVLMVGTVSTHVLVPLASRKPPYDPAADFTPVAELAYFPNVLVVNPVLPAKTVAELVALARRRPGEITFASNGNGTSNHLAGELLRARAGIELVHVPYKGGAPAIADVAGGHVFMIFNGVANVLPFTRAGRLRALAVASPRRSASLPQVPTMAESGYGGFEVDVWVGLFGPARLPAAVAERVATDAAAALRTPRTTELLVAQGAEIVGSGPARFAPRLAGEIARWRAVIDAAAIRVD